MKIFVTGATGVIGRRAVPMMVAAGHDVTAAGRSRKRLSALERTGASVTTIDLFDAPAVERAIDDHDAIVNLATHMPSSALRMMLPWSWKENDRIRREGSNLLVDAALHAGATRFIQESFAPVYPDCGDRWIKEATPIQPASYNRTVSDAERATARFATNGGTGIVLRFGSLYGPDALTQEMIGMVRKGWCPLPGSPSAYYSSVAQSDAASAVVAALGVPAGTYNVVDDEPLTRREFCDSLASFMGVRPPRFLPPWLTRHMGSTMECLGRSQRVSNWKIREATRWKPQYASVREGWPVVLDKLKNSASSSK